MTRRQARELAFILLFEKSFVDEPMAAIIEAAEESRDVKLSAFCRTLAEGADSRRPELDELILAHSKKWKEGRISRVAMAIMRLAVYEMLYVDDLEENISINEAVELAKTYGGDEDPSFVNGVLGGISRREQAEAGDKAEA